MTYVNNAVYQAVKKQNGQQFANDILSADSGIFDIPGLLKIVKYAGRNATPLIPYLNSLKKVETNEVQKVGDPFELLARAGYDAYYADTHEKHNRIRKYYYRNNKNDELVCFLDHSDRTDRYYVINAVKRNANSLRREDFTTPTRDDEYGTSVISIHIKKEGGFICITNRYNHTVTNPDNTFGSNPDNIIFGLSAALKAHFNTDFASGISELPYNCTIVGDRIVKYNHEVEGVYFGDDFYVKHGKIHDLDKGNQVMMDYFVLDTKTGTLTNPSSAEDGFVAAFNQEIKGKRVHITKDERGRRCIMADGYCVAKTNGGEIVSVDLPNVQSIGDNFLRRNTSLTEISLPSARDIGACFLFFNRPLVHINLPEAQRIGEDFLRNNNSLTELSLPKVKFIERGFFRDNCSLVSLSLPNVRVIPDDTLHHNETLATLFLPNVRSTGHNFLHSNKALTSLSMPNAEVIGGNFLYENESLTEISLPNVWEIMNNFLASNNKMLAISLPKARKIGGNFISDNRILAKASLPLVEEIANNFMSNNHTMTSISLPNVQRIGTNFFAYSNTLAKVFAPRLKEFGRYNLVSHEMYSKPFLDSIDKQKKEALKAGAADVKYKSGKRHAVRVPSPGKKPRE